MRLHMQRNMRQDQLERDTCLLTTNAGTHLQVKKNKNKNEMNWTIPENLSAQC